MRKHTAPEVLQRIDQQIVENIRYYAAQPKEVISRRIEDLEREWSIERVLETNASSFAMAGLILGLAVNKKWLFLTGGVLAFLFQHAVEGWCPPVPVLRRLGIRTRGEIDQEKYALKFLRGDFESISFNLDELRKNPVDDVYAAVKRS